MSSKKKKSSPKRKKVEIDYPEVPTQTWVPPDLRKKVIEKPPQTKYHKPEGMDQKLAVSSLKKMWNNFEIFGDRAVLVGTTSQNSAVFPGKTRGFQAPANVTVALTFAQMYEMPRWKSHYIDKILSIGNRVYMDSRKSLRDPHREIISLVQVQKTFYIGNEKITVDIKKDGIVKGPASLLNIESFGNEVKNFFGKEYSGVLVYQQKYYALWKQSKGFYLFDPYDCQKDGIPSTEIPHQGVACVIKCNSLGVILNHIISCSIIENVTTGSYSLTPVYIQRIVHVNTDYPDCLKDANLEVKPPPEKDILQPDGKQRGKPEKAPFGNEEPEQEEEVESVDEIEAGATGQGDVETVVTDFESGSKIEKEKVKEKKVAIPEKQQVEDVIYFINVIPERMTILRAATHQCHPNFSKYLGQQSFANAFSAIAMLHIYKSKLWTTKTTEDILKNAERIHHDSIKNLTGDQNMKVTDVCRKILCGGLDFTPRIVEYSAVGRLNSDKEDVSDLLRALKGVLSDDDAVIITGPLIVAVWCQEDRYFMWDPNERNERGIEIMKEEKGGSFTRKPNGSPGLACVTSYKYLKDMIQIYTLNVPRANRRDYFIISKVEMDDYVEEPMDWFNFKGLKTNKWILCGSFNQNDMRFSSDLRNTQCTSMAAMFLAYLHLTNVKEWTTEQVDEIIVAGNEYYGLCGNSLKSIGKFNNRMLMASELLTQFVIGNKKLVMNLEELCVYGTLSKIVCTPGFGFPFKQGLKQFFEENDYGILTCSCLSVAIFKIEDGYFVADSHSRNERGYVTSFGTAVVIRHLNTDDLANSLETNYSGSNDPTYNIHRVTYEVWDANDDGIVKPPVNNYTPINVQVAILRGVTSEDCPTRFPLTFGKQHVPMGLAVLGMIKLSPPALWTVDLLDEALNVGNNYYKRCIEQFYKDNQEPKDVDIVGNENLDENDDQSETGALNVTFADDKEEEKEEEDQQEMDDVDAITSQNVIRDYMIGINKFTLDFEEIQTGIIVDLPNVIQNIFQVLNVDENQQCELLIETKPLTVVLWYDNGLYYYFDPKPRDEMGQVYGKDEWTLLSPEELLLFSEENQHGDELNERLAQNQDEAETENEKQPDPANFNEQEKAEVIVTEIQAPPEEEIRPTATEDREVEGEGIDDKNPIEEEVELATKHSLSYWKRQEIDGMACVMWFTKLEDLINHVIENIAPRRRNQRFHISHVKMQNVVFTKDVYDSESGPKENKNDGNWHNFKEINHGHWILRGTTTLREIIFPISNIGHQYVSISFVAAAYVQLYAVSKFTTTTVDDILKYGDKLHTSTRRIHKVAIEGKQLKEEKRVCPLTKEEIDAILNLSQIDISDVVKKFCVGNYCVTITVTENLLQGELYQNNPEILTLERALYGFFGSAGVYAVLQTKGVHLFITKYHGAYFLFDPDCRGPSAHKSTIGDAIFSRHLDLDLMCSIIVSNLAVEGSNTFYIHSLELTVEPCERTVQIEEVPPSAPLKTSGFHKIIPGKNIISGTISIDSEKYLHLDKKQAAPVNMVALAMTLIHRTEHWTKFIIDEVIRIGSEIYQDVIDKNKDNFVPWETKMTVYLAPTDFRIGSIQVNCELRSNDQRGVVDIKSSRVQNLRHGLESFFEECTHGIISTYDLMMAVWKPEGQNRIYIFDGSRRGKSGMAAEGGAACLISFDTVKLLADHCIALTPEFGRRGAYVVVPIEIVVAKAGKKKLTRKAAASKAELEFLTVQRRKEEERLRHKGRNEYYEVHEAKMAILRGDRSQNSKQYSPNSRGRQDLTNCVIAYVMDKMTPLVKWTYRNINNVLNIGDQLFKDSVVMFNPTNPKLGLEAMQRNFIISNCMVKLAIGKPIMANNFNIENVTKSLEIFFGSRQFCLLNVDDVWLGLFNKNGQYYMFDPQDVDAHGKRMVGNFGEGFATIMRFDQLDIMVERMVQNLHCDYGVFYLNVIAIKDVVKLNK